MQGEGRKEKECISRSVEKRITRRPVWVGRGGGGGGGSEGFAVTGTRCGLT